MLNILFPIILVISEGAFDKKLIGAIVIEADTIASVDSDKDICNLIYLS